MFKRVLGIRGVRCFSCTAGRLANKVALVTGASSGIGREACIIFAREGAKVVACDVNKQGLDDTVSHILSQGGSATAQIVDVSKAEQFREAVKIAEGQYGGLHVVFNNAGVMLSGDDDAENTSEDTWNKTFDINVKGVWYGCREALPALRRSGGGSVINTASFVALRGAATAQLAYTSSKGAVLAMTRELACIHARENIRFNALCPGPIRTDLLMKFLDDEEKRQRRLVHLPMGRFAEAEEMAKAALFLASDDSSYVNGTDFLVDGGLCSAYVTSDKKVSPWRDVPLQD